MTISEINRQIVQEGLTRKSNERKQRMKDADHEAAERHLRTVINQITQERREETEAAQMKEWREAEAQRQRAERRAARKAHEEEELAQLGDCLLQVFGSLLFAALIALCFANGAIIAAIAIPMVVLAAVYSIVVFWKYATRKLNKEVAA